MIIRGPIRLARYIETALIATLVGLITTLYFTNRTSSLLDLKSKLHASAPEVTVPVCKIPELRVDDPAITKYYKNASKLLCKLEKNWVNVHNGTIYISEAAVRKYGKNITCDYLGFSRVDDFKTKITHRLADFANGTNVSTDFMFIDCLAKSRNQQRPPQRFHGVFSTVHREPIVVERTAKAVLPEKALGLNVYMFGFDSVSHMAFIRKLPKSYDYLKKNLDGIELNGYNIIGDGTPQALIPMFTGKTEFELPNTRKRFKNAQYVNVYPFIWNRFRDAGYVTMYAEDSVNVGTFVYRLKGFKEPPTDHYMRTFYVEAIKEYDKNPRLCLGSEPRWEIHYRYTEQMWLAYEDRRKFAFSFSDIAHDDFNLLGITDDFMLEHLKFFESHNYLNDTILVFMSDHGARYSTTFPQFRNTQQGKLEERLPIFLFVFPPWFKQKYPLAWRNFKQNAKDRLSTPFDIHQTLLDLLDFAGGSRSIDLERHLREKQRGISLFDEVPVERSCEHAGIETHWCTCLQWQQLPTDDSLVRELAHRIVAAINNETEEFRQKLCAQLRLSKIHSAYSYQPNSQMIKFKKSIDKDGYVGVFDDNSTSITEISYQLILETSPGQATYEASLLFNPLTNQSAINLANVGILNAYGDKPHCIRDLDIFKSKWCVCYDRISSR